MDGSHYSPNVITPTQYSSTESPANLQQPGLPPHTLPPLQQHASTLMQPAYNSYPQTPRTPATPNTPGSASTMGSYPPPPTTTAGRGSYQMMANNAYQTSQTYAASSAMMPQSSTALSHPQPIAPAPSPGSRAPPVLRPMPTGGVVPQQGISSPYTQSQMMPQASMLGENEPTHVVGSQGRRGILPSAPGRPAAPAAGTTPAKSQVPQKDADGKFPCPHCNKTYLHAKHLKRHLLRHTGDRPYMCVLCRDTFSRSDILKRHFQKCSIRRGNPTGVSHLSHPHAHVKKNAAGPKPLPEGGDLSHMNGMGNMPTDSTSMPFGLIATPDGMANDQNQLSRANNMSRLEDANDRDRRGVAGAGRPGFDQPYSGSVPPNTMAANMGSQMPNYGLTTAQNGMPIFAGQNSSQQQNVDWSSMFHAGAPTTYVHSFPPNNGKTQTGVKPEPSAAAASRPSAVPTGNHSNDADRSLFFASWDHVHVHDPYQELSYRLIAFLSPPAYSTPEHSADVGLYFSPENIRDCLEKYTHFHVHFAVLHIPTFRILEAYSGLLAGVCCIGACYLDRMSADHVRNMVSYLKAALERDSNMLVDPDYPLRPDVNQDGGPFGTSDRDIEELQAILLMHTLLVWNGTPAQREEARQIFPLIAQLARRARLLTVSNDATLCSLFHQPGFSPGTLDASSFDWTAWVQQEKRIRILLAIFSVDVALGLFFNSAPLFDALEVQIPLASDDAAWEAQDPRECAEALGLYGPEAAAGRNPDGTQRAKQPEMHLALRALLHGSYQIQTGTTNLYGKFILVHALLALIRKAQTEGHAAVTNRSSTPLSHNDWIVGLGQDVMSGQVSAATSGRTTPVEGVLPPQTLGMFATALDKFKRNWDVDMATQFPPSSTNPRRHGFSRDGVHYYWLANYLLRNTRAADLAMAPDQRFTQVIRLLKSVRSWVMRDGTSRGEELGSIGEIDRDYGVQNLTLDMVNLFKPLPQVVESVGIPSVKADIGTGNLV